MRVEPSAKPTPRARIVVTTFGDGGLEHRLWSVTADGTVKPVAFPAEGLTGTVAPGYGSDGPLPSPDGRWVSYKPGGRRAGDLVIRNIETSEIVVVAKASPDTELLAVDWSPKSDRLLWSAVHIDDPDGIVSDDAIISYSIFELARRASEQVPLNCPYEAFLATGELLVKCKLPKAWGDGHQFRVGDNGAIAFIRNHDVVVVTPSAVRPKGFTEGGRFAEYQFPKPSPSGIHVAYEHQLRDGSGHVRINLAVDGKTIAEEVGGYDWIDDETIAVSKFDPSPPVVMRLQATMGQAR